MYAFKHTYTECLYLFTFSGAETPAPVLDSRQPQCRFVLHIHMLLLWSLWSSSGMQESPTKQNQHFEKPQKLAPDRVSLETCGWCSSYVLTMFVCWYHVGPGLFWLSVLVGTWLCLLLPLLPLLLLLSCFSGILLDYSACLGGWFVCARSLIFDVLHVACVQAGVVARARRALCFAGAICCSPDLLGPATWGQIETDASL